MRGSAYEPARARPGGRLEQGPATVAVRESDVADRGQPDAAVDRRPDGGARPRARSRARDRRARVGLAAADAAATPGGRGPARDLAPALGRRQGLRPRLSPAVPEPAAARVDGAGARDRSGAGDGAIRPRAAAVGGDADRGARRRPGDLPVEDPPQHHRRAGDRADARDPPRRGPRVGPRPLAAGAGARERDRARAGDLRSAWRAARCRPRGSPVRRPRRRSRTLRARAPGAGPRCRLLRAVARTDARAAAGARLDPAGAALARPSLRNPGGAARAPARGGQGGGWDAE